jgi:hypothetical protein
VDLSTSATTAAVLPGSSFPLIASVSGPAWDETIPVSYQWECSALSNDANHDDEQKQCGVELGNNAFIIIPADSLTPGSYFFRVNTHPLLHMSAFYMRS